MSCDKGPKLVELFVVLILTLTFTGLPVLIYKDYKSMLTEHAKYVKTFESPQSLADYLNDWHENSLEKIHYFKIPNGVSRKLIEQTYPLLNFTIEHEHIEIENQRIILRRSEIKPKMEKQDEL